MVPQNIVQLTGKDAEGAVKLVNALEDNDDVQNVYSNMDVDESRAGGRRLTKRAAPRCAYWASIPARSASVTASSSVRRRRAIASGSGCSLRHAEGRIRRVPIATSSAA